MILMTRCVVGLLVLLFATDAFSYGVGYSTYPLSPSKQIISGEFAGTFADGGGVGTIGRFTTKLNGRTTFDGGLSLQTGDINNRLFAGVDYEVFPDYQQQPRFSVKGMFGIGNEFGKNHNLISIMPVVSKGVSFWGTEGFPFASLPVELDLNTDSGTYLTKLKLSLGITGKLPIKGYEHLTGNLETTFNLKDSYSGVLMGVSYPLN